MLAFSPAHLTQPIAAAPVVLADAPGAAGLTAVNGHVIFSRPDASGRWRLMQVHDGRVSALAVPSRRVPFDADGGTDRRGAPVVVFSRCAQEPAAAPLTSGELDWSRARGCRIVELDLTSGRSKTLRPAHLAADASLSTPTIMRGRVAAALHAGGRLRVLLWAAGSRVAKVLTDRAVGARSGNSYDMVSMDLGVRSLAYAWRLTGPSVVGLEGWELRSLRLGGDRSSRIESGAASGTCGFREPITPTALADGGVAYAVLSSTACDELQSALVRVEGDRQVTEQQTDAQALAAATDGATTYWLRGHVSKLAQGVPCSVAGSGCQIVATG